MNKRLFFIAIFVFLLGISPSEAKECALPHPTQINVNPETREIQYDFEQSLAQIQRHGMDTTSPYSFHAATYTQGFMKGAIRMEPRVQLGGFTLPHLKTACIWYESIDLNIEIDPKIVIAEEVYADPCTRKAVLDHEMKHIYADRKIVNKYAKIMGNKVYEGLKRKQFAVGPIPISQKGAVIKEMQDTVFDLIQSEYKNMERERQSVQQDIDTLEEYERVSGLCPKAQTKIRRSAAQNHDHNHSH